MNDMNGELLRTGRQRAGWTQERLAARLGLSQVYVSLMEHGKRKISPQVARDASRWLGLAPTALPLPEAPRPHPASESWLERAVARLGYPGFAYARAKGRKRNPVEVLLNALSRDRLDPRLTESLPWLLLRFESFDHERLVSGAKLANLQNRLGFVVTLARELAETRVRWNHRVSELQAIEALLEPARLAREDTLGTEIRSERMSRWLRRHRSDAAEHWNLLTDLQAEQLPYADDDRGTLPESRNAPKDTPLA